MVQVIPWLLWHDCWAWYPGSLCHQVILSTTKILIMRHIENPSWVPMWNGVHPSEFVFQKSQAIVSDFCGIQTHSGELLSAWVPMIDSISAKMFFCDNKNLGNHPQIVRNHSQRPEITGECGIKTGPSTMQEFNYQFHISRGCCEIWEALVLRTSNMASALVRNQMCTCLRLIKLICAIIICSSIGRVLSDSHLSNKAKIAFRTIGRLFWRPLISVKEW